jgi:hypothetical protein
MSVQNFMRQNLHVIQYNKSYYIRKMTTFQQRLHSKVLTGYYILYIR